MSVNISARQLTDPELVALVTSALARHGVPAAQLVLEITETALMTDPAAAETAEALAALGVRPLDRRLRHRLRRAGLPARFPLTR